MADVTDNANPSNLPANTVKRVSNGTGNFKLLQDDELIAFTGATPATTGATSTTPFGFTTAAQADALVTNVREMRAALIATGIMKNP
jgi:hypothetical protein